MQSISYLANDIGASSDQCWPDYRLYSEFLKKSHPLGATTKATVTTYGSKEESERTFRFMPHPFGWVNDAPPNKRLWLLVICFK